MTGNAKRQWQYWLPIALIVAASALRVFICFQHNPMDSLSSDMLRHWNNGLRFPRGGYTGAADPIGYQVYMFALERVTQSNRFLVALAAALMSVAMPWTYYRAARGFGLSKIPGLWAWALIALAPSLMAIYHFIMMETLLLLLEGLALWMTARYLRRGGRRAFLLFVFCWTLACLTKPTVAPLAGICFLWVWWKRATPMRHILLGAALAFVMLLPQVVRSYVVLGFVAPFGNPWLTRIQLRSGVKTIHLYVHAPVNERERFHLTDTDMQFLSPSCVIAPLEPLSHWAMRRAWDNSQATITIDSSHGERDWKQAYDSFDNDPDEWLAQGRENVILFLFSPSWPEVQFGQWDGHLEYGSRWIWAPLILFVFVFNLRDFARRRFYLLPVATTVFTLVLAFQNMVIMEGRYRKVVEPLLLLNAVWVLAAHDRTNRRTATPELQIAACAVTGSGAPKPAIQG